MDLMRAAPAAFTGGLTIRAARLLDVPVVTAIYNEGIRGRGATFETVERTPGDVRAWLTAPDAATHPFLVAERPAEGRDPASVGAPTAATDVSPAVVGWVRASAYRPRACYAGIGDFSVYVTAAARGQRVGDVLLGALLDACTGVGMWKVLARIFPENAASRALCARHGFREVGTYERHGQLDGIWRDVVIVERLLPASGVRISGVPAFAGNVSPRR